jgi:hypothetical protein
MSARWSAAIAALAAGIAGAVVGFLLARQEQELERVVVEPAPSPSPSTSTSASLSGASASDLLLATLESAESGRAAADGDHSAQIILTFETEEGRYCRAFGSRDANAAAEGVACRNGGQWQIVAWDGTVDPSEGFATVASNELLEDVMDRLGGGTALEADEERALIERHWPAPQK